MIKKFFKAGFSLVAIVGLITLSSCNSGSKADAVAPGTDSTANVASDSVKAATPATPDSTATASTTSTEAKTTDAKATTHTVIIDNMKFTPATLTIKKGDKVTFTNKDIVGHNATAKDNSWTSPTLNTGDSWSTTPQKTVDYSCTIHPTMIGKIIVQ